MGRRQGREQKEELVATGRVLLHPTQNPMFGL